MHVPKPRNAKSCRARYPLLVPPPPPPEMGAAAGICMTLPGRAQLNLGDDSGGKDGDDGVGEG